MKTLLGAALTVSLVLNIAIAVLLVRERREPPPASASAVVPVASPDETRTKGQTWSRLKDGDPAAQVSRLRAAGFPPDVIRAILRAQIAEETAASRKALLGDQSSRPFWRNDGMDARTILALRQLNRDQDRRLRELLGADAYDPISDGYLSRSLSFSFLSPEKAQDVTRVLAEFEDRRTEAFGTGFMDPAKIAAIEREQHEALAQVLTPEELLDYDLRNSNTARSMRDRLAAFDPTEQEFRAIFALQSPFDARWTMSSFLAGDEARQRMEAERQLATEIKSHLAPERAAIYDRATDYNYVRTSQLVARLELPAATTDQLFAVQKEFEQRRADLYRGGMGISRDEMMQKGAALQQEALGRITPLLGTSRNVEAYRQYGGYWLDQIVPRFPTRPPTATPGNPPAAPVISISGPPRT